MAYDEQLAIRIRQHLAPYGNDVTEKRMFGGLSFLYKGKMSVGIVKNELCVRAQQTEVMAELNKPYVRPMDFTGKPMKEMIFVSTDGITAESDLAYYINLGIAHAESKQK